MRRIPFASLFFRPQLEHLERRDLPSAAGMMLPSLVQPLPQLSQQMTALVQQMNTDFNQLKTDVANAAPFPDNLVGFIATDYTKVSNDLGQIQGLNTVITSAAQIDQALLFMSIANGTFDKHDLLAVVRATKTIKSATDTAASDLAQANTLAGTNPGNGFPTISSQLHP